MLTNKDLYNVNGDVTHCPLSTLVQQQIAKKRYTLTLRRQ